MKSFSKSPHHTLFQGHAKSNSLQANFHPTPTVHEGQTRPPIRYSCAAHAEELHWRLLFRIEFDWPDASTLSCHRIGSMHACHCQQSNPIPSKEIERRCRARCEVSSLFLRAVFLELKHQRIFSVAFSFSPSRLAIELDLNPAL